MFKKRIKNVDIEFEELSQMLFLFEEDPTLERDFLLNANLEFSLESLKKIDDYLEKIKSHPEFENNYSKIVLRVGAYVGQVIKLNSKKNFHWYDFENSIKINRELEQFGESIATVALLIDKDNDETLFPLAKVCKFLENGREDSVYFFAQVAIDEKSL